MKFLNNIKASKTLYVGASSPLGYCYRANNSNRPLPILENPMSYFLFYDNICFFNRDLCPKNMQKLKFVSFLEEDYKIEKDLSEIVNDKILLNDKPEFDWDWEYWNKVIVNTAGTKWGFDNHLRTINFHGIDICPRPNDCRNILLDEYISKEFNMDLAVNSTVENSYKELSTNQLKLSYKELSTNQLKLLLSEQFLSTEISSIQTNKGPWHESINDLRNDSLIREYRRKIQEVSIDSIYDIEKRIVELKDEYENISTRIVAEHNDNTFLTKSIISVIIGFFSPIPIISAGELIIKAVNSNKEKKRSGWVSFVSKTKMALKSSN
jgi:hypothetical protein